MLNLQMQKETFKNLYYPKYSLFDSFGSSVSLGTLSVQVCSDLQLSWISWSGGEPTPLQLVPHLPRVSQGMSIENSCTVAVYLRAAVLMETQHFFSKGHTT